MRGMKGGTAAATPVGDLDLVFIARSLWPYLWMYRARVGVALVKIPLYSLVGHNHSRIGS